MAGSESRIWAKTFGPSLQAQPAPWLMDVSLKPSRISFSPAMNSSSCFFFSENTAYCGASQIANTNGVEQGR
jgi:hypothetical protein